MARDGAFLGIDLGENYPRGVNLHTFDAKGLRSRVVYTFKVCHAESSRSLDGRSYPVYREASSLGKTFYQWSNDNRTYTELGGVVETDRGITVVFSGEADPSRDARSRMGERRAITTIPAMSAWLRWRAISPATRTRCCQWG